MNSPTEARKSATQRIRRYGALILIACACTGCRSARPFGAAAAGPRERIPFPGGGHESAAATIEPHVVAYRDYRDPLIGFNRVMFAFNDKAYRYALIPAGKGYSRITPDPVERRISNFFYNLKTPIYAVNHLLQFKLTRLGRNISRFTINSTAGLLGLFDPAAAWLDLERAETHLEDTLAQYGAGYGIYLVLPIFGPSDVRGALSTVGDYFLDPVPYLLDQSASSAVQSFDHLQDFARGADRYEELHRQSDDPYIFFRNLYLQGVQRDAAY